MSPPTYTTSPEVVAPERDREAGCHLPRTLRDQIARRFMTEFGMTGATAVRYAKAFIAKEDLDALTLRIAAEEAETRADEADRICDEACRWIRRRKLSACDQRVGGPNWRTRS